MIKVKYDGQMLYLDEKEFKILIKDNDMKKFNKFIKTYEFDNFKGYTAADKEDFDEVGKYDEVKIKDFKFEEKEDELIVYAIDGYNDDYVEIGSIVIDDDISWIKQYVTSNNYSIITNGYISGGPTKISDGRSVSTSNKHLYICIKYRILNEKGKQLKFDDVELNIKDNIPLTGKEVYFLKKLMLCYSQKYKDDDFEIEKFKDNIITIRYKGTAVSRVESYYEEFKVHVYIPEKEQYLWKYGNLFKINGEHVIFGNFYVALVYNENIFPYIQALYIGCNYKDRGLL